MPSLIYDSCLEELPKGLNFEAAPIRVMLVTEGYFPDKPRHSKVWDVDHEVRGEGYIPGGSLTYSQIVKEEDYVDIILGEVNWKELNLVTHGAVYYFSDSEELISYVDFGQNINVGNVSLSISPSIIRIQE